jgi:beta-N-acetylhexosaminidase
MAFGATRSRALAREAGESLARSLRSLGFDLNFAPVLDVLSNPANTALGTRAFGSDPQLVAQLGRAFIEGELRGGILPVAKHFPGQGGTAGDSHYKLPLLESTRAELETYELIPFKAAIAAGVPAIMTAHIAVPHVAESPALPATLSHRLLTDILRRDLRFKGLAITDELQMRAVQGRRKIGEVAVDALLAGADMIMVVWDHQDREEIYAALKANYASGRLPQVVVDRALRHVMAAKATLAGTAAGAAPRAGEQEALVERIAERSMTLEAPHQFAHVEDSDTVVFVGADGPLRQRFPHARWIATPARVDDEIVRHALGIAAGARTIVAAIATENDRLLLQRMRHALPAIQLVVVCLASPSLVAGIAQPDSILYAYSDLEPFQIAAARVLLHGARAPGMLPLESDKAP